jgi:PAS domain S-box-containing protein
MTNEESMFRSPERQAGLLDIVSDAIIVRNLAGQILYWNGAAETLYGWSREQAIGRVNHELLRTIFPVPFENIEKALRDTGHWDGDLHQTVQDGSTVIVSSRWAVRDTETNEVQILESNRDITTHKTYEQAFAGVNRELMSRVAELQQSERRFRALVELGPDAVVIVNSIGEIVLVNSQTEKQFGYTRDELLGQSVDVLLPERFRSRHAKDRLEYMSSPRARSMGEGLDLFGLRKNGNEFPVEISFSPIETSTGVLISSAIRDVSERRRLGAALDEKNAQLESADRAKDLFLASMSHELRSPLHTIIGFADLLAEEIKGPLNKEQKHYIAHILDDSNHLLALINDVLDLSKIRAGELRLHMEFFDILDAMNEVVSSLQLQINAKDLHVETTSDGCPMLHADHLRFKQILCNLVGNAIKFTPDDGSIRIDSTQRDGFIEITVTDTGIGIAKEDHDAVFDKFYQVGATTRRQPQGTGLGLSITRALVERHGGRIWLESDRGKGSRFTFTIPSAQIPPSYADCGSLAS